MALWTRSQEEDDFFGKDESDDADESVRRCLDGYDGTNGLAAQEQAALEEQYRTLGYHETYETSQEETMQEGFITGYKETFDIALNIGTLLGQAAADRLQFSRPTSRITLQEKRTGGGGTDGPFGKAIARTREVLSTTMAQEPGATLPVPASQGDDLDGISAARTKPLIDLQIEVERLLLSDEADECK